MKQDVMRSDPINGDRTSRFGKGSLIRKTFGTRENR